MSGYSWPVEAWQRALAWRPDVISAQGTTLDDGAYLLGSDKMYTRGGKLPFRRAMELVLSAAKALGIPAVFSAGDSGHDIGLEGALRVIDEVTAELGIRMRLAVISGELPKSYLLDRLERGVSMPRLIDHPRLSPWLTTEDVVGSTRVVAQMGPEPIMRALEMGVDGVVTGRALDEAPHLALPLLRGFDRGVAAHMAKIVETAQSGGTWRTPHLVTLHRDRFEIQPAHPAQRCTPTSVASVALYERQNPYAIAYPGGVLELDAARYEPVDDVTVAVSGARWRATPYTVKLEGARFAGHRCLGIAGARDPRFIREIDAVLRTVEQAMADGYPGYVSGRDYRFKLHVFGRNAVMEDSEPVQTTASHELGIVVDAVAWDEAVARAICYRGLHTLLMCDYPGRRTTSGNVAWGTSPEVIEAGEAYEFSIHHLLPLDDPCEPFRVEVLDFPRRAAA
ncbi:MAG: acyclic terpene utilization AtuA family protein [Chloroflexi bacterium]|nr:acyclic terpene utilization AtuA family protein [Chloroflexota bacterium]